MEQQQLATLMIVIVALFIAWMSFNIIQGNQRESSASKTESTEDLTRQTPLEVVYPEYNKPYRWEKTVTVSGNVVVPVKSDVFLMTLGKEKMMFSTTDCNSLRGSYTITDTELTFGPMASTMMACEYSQETEYAKMLGEAKTYTATKGSLVLGLADGGKMFFILTKDTE